jgi:hypothetical protein
LVLFLWASEAKALVNGFTWTPQNPVMGQMITLTTTSDGGAGMPASWLWESQYTANGQQTSWATIGTQSTVGYCRGIPGTWNIRLTVTYFPFGMPPVQPGPTQQTNSVTFAPADGFTVASGLETTANFNTPIWVRFTITAGGTPCGPGLSVATPQEQIVGIWMLSPPFPGPPWYDSPWSGPNGDFYLAGNQILDLKQQSIEGIWDDIQRRRKLQVSRCT